MIVRNLVVRINEMFVKHPMTKGMVAYSILWPTGCLVQEIITGKENGESYNWAKCARFSFYGTFIVAPTMYSWVKLSSIMWPQTNLRTAIYKVIVEQCSYGPFSSALFFFGMSLLEFKSVAEAKQEVCDKFFPTFKIGVCVWPIIQTINFSVIPERNRVPFVSVCSFLWTIFLAYMKQLQVNKELLMESHSGDRDDG